MSAFGAHGSPFGGAAGGGAARAFVPSISGAPTADPGDVVLGNATAVKAGRIRVVTQNPAVVSRLPSDMARWETTEIRDLRGALLTDADLVDLGDVMMAIAFAENTLAPTDVCIAVGFSSGAVNATNRGCCVMLQASSGAWLVHHGLNTGAGWAYTAAGASSSSTRGGVMQTQMGTALAQNRLNAYAVDSVFEPITANTTQTAPSTTNTGNDYDRMFVAVGWATGVGGAGATIDLGFGAVVQRLRDLALFPFAPATPTSFTSPPARILLLGHSIANGTVADATKGGVAVPSGWTYRNAGVNASTWPVGVGPPACGTAPYLVDAAIAAGVTSGNRYLIRRATNGIDTSGTSYDTLIAGARDDVVALGLGDPDVIVLWCGANDAQSAGEFTAYTQRRGNGLRRVVELLHDEFPGARILLMGEYSADAVNYTYVASGQVDAFKQTLAAELSYCKYVSSTSPSNYTQADAIHPDVPGFVTMAGRAAAAW